MMNASRNLLAFLLSLALMIAATSANSETRSVDTEVHISASPEDVLHAFVDDADLRAWWEWDRRSAASQSRIRTRRVNGSRSRRTQARIEFLIENFCCRGAGGKGKADHAGEQPASRFPPQQSHRS